MVFNSKNNLNIFYRCLLGVCFFACRNAQDKAPAVTLRMSNEYAAAVSFSAAVWKDVPRDSVAQLITVIRNGDRNRTAILGAFSWSDSLVFTPLLPFSNGLTYEVLVRNKSIATFSVPQPSQNNAPVIAAVYPVADTLPENLLKMYISFSQPMREREAYRHISLLKNGTDTLHGVFLDLQPELWNEDNTVLTLWLDPGRIKRGLQPNLRLGNPLHGSEHYTLAISDHWRDKQGRSLKQPFTKTFITTGRDESSPSIGKWKLELPAATGNDPLQIRFGEALDHFLLISSLTIHDSTGNRLNGSWTTNNKDSSCSFKPSLPWTAGRYSLTVDPVLEDLAGNNLDRLFDTDTQQPKTASSNPAHSRIFRIQP